MVLIWARSLPFVPDASAGGLSVALAVYKDGREHFYALQAVPDSDSEASAETFRIGQSRFQVRHTPHGVSLRATLDIEVTGAGRVRGVVEVNGASTRLEGGSHGPLDWAPISLAARGHAYLAWQDGSVRVAGRAYFDGNAADTPLDQMGIRDWRWGRVALPHRDLVYFILSSAEATTGLGLSVDEAGHGTEQQLSASIRDGAPGWFGLRRAQSLVLTGEGEEATIDFLHQVEDGPFYQRYLVEATTSRGERGRGVAERVVPGRLGQAWHRPLVNMRVDRIGRRRSIWLPLFAGASEGRVRRLVSSWLRGPKQVEVYP